MDIAEFLTARYVEEERIARAAVGRYADGSAWGPSWTYDRENFRVLIDGQAAVAAENTSDVDGEHIARHDPARVLADIAAKRKLLALWQQMDADLDLPKFHQAADELLAQLLAPFDAHPDYDPAWRIDG